MSQVFEADDGSFDVEVIQADLPVLVDFSATWCGPCKKLDPIVHEIADEYDGKLKVVHVDVDKARNAAARYGVLSIPNLLLIKGGEVKEQVIGLLSKEALIDKIKAVM